MKKIFHRKKRCVTCSAILLFEFRRPIVPYFWVTRLMLKDQFNFFPVNFPIGSLAGLPNNLTPNRKIPSLLFIKITFPALTVWTAKISERIGKGFSYVDFAVRIRYLINDFQAVINQVLK